MLYKKILTFLFMSAALTISGLHTISANAEQQADFTYTIINNEATIIGYSGEPVYLEIPEEIEQCPVTQIRDNAFFNCSSLKQISLPSTITKIGHHTFYSCSSLESVVLPETLEELGMGAFGGCVNLSAVSIPDNLSVLPDACFQSCVSLTETVIPSGITTIGNMCFSGCTSLSYVSIGENTREIGSQAFYMCTSLKNLYIPPSVIQIGHEAAGYELGEYNSTAVNNFTILGESGSAAESYALMNNMNFSPSSEAVQAISTVNANVKKVPMWIIVLLAFGGIVFFTLSCIIAFKQHCHEKSKNRTQNF